MKRPDFSEYVVHFTKDALPRCATRRKKDKRIANIAKQNAKERLFSILKEQQIYATIMPWTDNPAICFTECTWSSLLIHANKYSCYGIGFKKSFLFNNGGGPVIYLRQDLWLKQKELIGNGKQFFHPRLGAFITPFNPDYASDAYKKEYWKDTPIDYTHEREWRVPDNLNFNYIDIDFIIVNNHADTAGLDITIRNSINQDKWLFMANYKQIEEIWPPYNNKQI